MSATAIAGKGWDSIETASVDELRSLQLQRLRWSIRHTYENVPHFRLKCERQGVSPGDLHALDDLPKFPFMTKEDFREQYPFGLLAVPRDRLARIHASSGTTGRPTVVGYTLRDLQTWAHVVARSIYAAGGRAGQIVHIAYGYGLFTGGIGAHYGAERLGCTVVPMSGGQTERQVQLIREFEPHVIMVTPSYLLNIAEEFVRQGVDAASCSLKIAICGAEPWTLAMRKQIEARMGLDALDIYGLSEVIGPGVAQECIESKDGPAIWEDHFFPEIIDPVTGRVLPDGSPGELVLTSLTKEALPVIRYRTRDLTTLLAPTSRTMRRLAKISGRSDDMLIIRGVNVFPSQIEELILNQAELSPHYQLEIGREGNLDTLTIKVELVPQHAHDLALRAAAAAALVHNVKAHIGIRVRVVACDADELPRSAGKARRVFDRRGI